MRISFTPSAMNHENVVDDGVHFPVFIINVFSYRAATTFQSACHFMSGFRMLPTSMSRMVLLGERHCGLNTSCYFAVFEFLLVLCLDGLHSFAVQRWRLWFDSISSTASCPMRLTMWSDAIRNEISALCWLHTRIALNIAFIKSELRCRSSCPVMSGIPLNRRERSPRYLVKSRSLSLMRRLRLVGFGIQ